MNKEMTFEQAMSKLEEIVAKIEDKDLPLEKSLQLFSEGATLAAYCRGILKTAKLKVEELALNMETKDEQ